MHTTTKDATSTTTGMQTYRQFMEQDIDSNGADNSKPRRLNVHMELSASGNKTDANSSTTFRYVNE